eukprot:Nk52_evm1s258 gene=Nk52_evmTU1s258
MAKPVVKTTSGSPKAADLEKRVLPASFSSPAALHLEDGSCMQGFSFGAERPGGVVGLSGECVFQTGMVGYTEALTDPSYRGQILVLTYPLIGNYGVPAGCNEEEQNQAKASEDCTYVMDGVNHLVHHFESSKIHVAGLIVQDYCGEDKHSHWRAMRSLGDWLRRENVPGLFGIDTRQLTIKIREHGVMLGKIMFPEKEGSTVLASPEKIPFRDPNEDNLVALVSRKEPHTFQPTPRGPREDFELYGDFSKAPLKIIAVDVGMKNNQIRCFTRRNVILTVVPWDYDFHAVQDQYDGIFLSNGPGDPTMCAPTIAHLKKVLATYRKPVFGICLGHQLMALAAGCRTIKLKYGNRGHNIPCTDMRTGECHITSQNHGYAVDPESIPSGMEGGEWKQLFVNANDGTNEGIMHSIKPFFSVQFHPESHAGPRDPEPLFDSFLTAVRLCKESPAKFLEGKPASAIKPSSTHYVNSIPQSPIPCPEPVPSLESTRQHVRKVLVLGSGGLSIGQAGEFDYSGSQAIKALKEEGISSVLINPNIATIQTSKGLADKVYFLPVTPEMVLKVIRYEKPDGIFVAFGGQTALNCAIQIRHDLERMGVRVLGTPIETIMDTEDRKKFADIMAEIGHVCARNAAANTVEDTIIEAEKIGYPVILRAAFALGGLGSGFANNREELVDLAEKAFAVSPQVLVERSMKGWKEVEYEVVRDINDNCITVCNMENFDPVGIHTGDSIVVAPSQTLNDREYQLLRDVAIRTIRRLGVVGECNIQYSVNPNTEEYCIIEVNARLSRSSALASKATGYPLAFVAAKLGLGIPLTEVMNAVTRETCACFEPSLDYCVVKIPRWDLRKFTRVSSNLNSAMKSVGEVMSIGRNFEEAMQKAIRSLNDSYNGFSARDLGNTVEDLDTELRVPSDQRLFVIANALNEGYTVDRIHELTHIDYWFLNKLKHIIDYSHFLASIPPKDGHSEGGSLSALTHDVILHAKKIGMSDRQIAVYTKSTELAVRHHRREMGIIPFVKQIDTVAAEFPAQTNYLYMTYNASGNDVEFDDKGVIVLGSGVYRIGSSVEFDWCAVRAVRTIREAGLKSVMINYNPETVSTDYDESDRLYFEELTLERVLDVYDAEQSQGVVISMGGQVPNNIALPLHRQNVKIFGTSPVQIDMAENRYKFSRLLDSIGVDQPQWKELTSLDEAAEFCNRVSYPVLVRPSYVLSGAAMNVVNSADDLEDYLGEAVSVSREHPVVITKFIMQAKEIEVDAVAKNGSLIMHVISEHVENAGVHSGDATLIQPPQDLSETTMEKIRMATEKIANALNVTGPMNIQFIAKNNEIKVIECNVRASRSFPFVSKTLDVDLIEMATRAMLNLPVEAYPRQRERQQLGKVCVKVPQFSFGRLSGADPVLGVEMASTGEVACFGTDKYEAYIKALVATGFKLPKFIKGPNGKTSIAGDASPPHQPSVLLSLGSYREKTEFLPSVRQLVALGFKIYATPGSADFLSDKDLPVTYLDYIASDTEKSDYSISEFLSNNRIDLYVCLPSNNRYRRPASYMSRGYHTRRMAIDFQVPLITNIKCAKIFVEALARGYGHIGTMPIQSHDYISSNRSLNLPGLVNMGVCVDSEVMKQQPTKSGLQTVHDQQTYLKTLSSQALAGGFTQVGLYSPAVQCRDELLRLTTRAQESMGVDFVAYVSGANPAKVGSTNEDGAEAMAGYSGACAGLMLNLSEKCKENQLSYCSLADVESKVKHWPSDAPVIVNASDLSLPAALFFANLYDRDVHVTQISSVEELALVQASKERGIKVTCDVNPLMMFDDSEDAATRDYFWANLNVIDCFATTTAASAHCDAVLPLLLDAVNAGRLTVDDIILRLHTNPMQILKLPEQVDTYVEVDLDQVHTVVLKDDVVESGANAAASEDGFVSVNTRKVRGSVRRVMIRGELAFVDGSVCLANGSGRDVRIEQHGIVKAGSSSVVSATKASQNTVSIGQIPTNVLLGGTTHSQASSMLMLSKGSSQQSLSVADSVEVAAPHSPIVGSAAATVASPTTSMDNARSMGDAMSTSAAVGASAGMPSSPLVGAIRRNSTMSHDASSKHLLSVAQWQRKDLHRLFQMAQEMRTLVERMGAIDMLKGKVLTNLFYEPSTRTQCSFQSAMQRLGGQVINVDVATSSVAKGESLQDTIRCVDCYSDIIVLRHPTVGSVQSAALVSNVPVINAGDGTGEHPTQAMLDLYTIREELGTVNGLTITVCGDLKHGRTCHSLVQLLCLYNVKLQYVAASPDLEMPEEVCSFVERRGVPQRKCASLREAMAESDVLYVTRIQRERFGSEEEYEAVKGRLVVTPAVMTAAKENMVVLHPMPRVDEISEEVDYDPRAAYFRQMKYGMYVRMALLAKMMGKY